MENKKILIVENEISIALHISEVLSSKGAYTVQIAVNGTEALEIISTDIPDLVIMDILLGEEMDGIEVSEIIRAQYDIPIIYVTASTDEKHVARACKVEPYGYIIKPINETELNCTVGIVLQKHESEKKIRESEERYRSLFEGADDHIFLVNRDLKYFAANPSALQVGGFQLEDIAGKGPHEIFPEDGDFYLSRYRNVLQTGEAEHFERKLRLPDGFRWFSVILSPIKDEKGEIVGLTGISRDITEWKNAEEMLKKREQEIRIIADNVPGLFSYLDTEGRYRFVSKRYEEWFGISREEVIGRHYREVLGENTYDLIRNHVDVSLSGQQARYEAELPYRHGGKKWVIAEYVPFFDEKGAVDGFFALVIDITERKQMEEALKESEETYRLVANNMLDLVAMCDKNGMFTFLSPSYKSVLGYSPEELIDNPIQSLVHSDDLPEVMNQIEEGRKSLEPATAVYRMTHKDKSILWFETNGRVVFNESGEPVGAVFSTREITKRKRAENEKRKIEIQEREHLQSLKFLSQSAMELLDYPADGNLYEFIGEKLHEIIQNAVIIVNSYDGSSNTLCCRDIRGLGGLTEKVVTLIGRSPVGMVMPLTIDEAWERLHTGRIIDGPEGLHDLSFGEIPKRAARAIERLLGIKKIHAIGFVSEGKLFGTAIFIMRSEDRIPWDMVETFLHQAALALQRRQMVDALSESERKYRDLVENISDVIYMLDGEGIITYISPIVKTLYGYDPDDIIGKHFTDLVHQEDLDRIVEGFERSLHGNHLTGEYRLMTRSGDIRWFRVSERTIFEGDIPTGVRGILTDITEKKHAEDALRESEERFRDIVENAEVGYFYVDTEGYYRSVNRSWLRMHGYSSADEVVGKHFSITQVETDLEESTRLGEQVLQGEKPNTKEFTRRCKDGTICYHSFASRQVVSEGKIVGIEGFMTDLTERKRMEQKLRESESLLKETGKMAKVGGWELDVETKQVFWTSETYRIHDVPEDEKYDLSMAIQFFDLPGRNILEASLKRAMEQGEPFDLDLLFTSATGRHLCTRAMGHAVMVDGRVMKLRGTFQDITERKRAEELAHTQRDLGLALGEVLGLDEAMGLCLETAIRISEMDSGGIYLLDEISGAFDLVIHQGLSNDFVSKALHYEADSINAQLIMEGRPIYSEYRRLIVPLKTFEMRENLSAIAILPVRYKDRIIACLNVASHTTDEVPTFARTALEAITAQMGSVIASKRAEEALRQSEALLKATQRLTRVGGWEWDVKKQRMFWTDEVYRIHGFEPYEIEPGSKEHIERNLECYDPEDSSEILEAFNRCIEKGEPYDLEFPFTTAQGERIWIRTTAEPVFEDGGVVRVIGNIMDITDSKVSEEKLRESEEKARVLLDAQEDVIFLIDNNEKILDVNESALRRFNRTRDDLIGMYSWDLLPDELVRSRKAQAQKAKESMKSVRFEDFREGIWNDNTIYPILDESANIAQLAVFARDITEKKTLEREIMNISENERKRVGQELHDGLGQLLTGIAYITEVLKDKLAEKGYEEALDAEKISTLIDNAIEQTRSIARGLYPMISEPAGIFAALENLAEQTERIFGIRCRVRRRGAVRIADSAVAINLYYIAQEALNNAIKHGKARNILLQLVTSKSKITFTINDDGVGCSDEQLNTTGMGYKIMRHRAEQIGAELSYAPGEDRGFTVTLSL